MLGNIISKKVKSLVQIKQNRIFTIVEEMADAMVSSGMKDAGYQYINIDDCWQIARDRNGNILADSIKFPSGIKAVADYIHSKGLKFGIYTCAGLQTCA